MKLRTEVVDSSSDRLWWSMDIPDTILPMKLTPYQLSAHLRQGLLPAYLVSGDEPLLVQEAADAIRLAAQQNGAQECLRFTVDTHFDWSLFRKASMSDSFFSAQQIIVLRLANPKMGDVGGKLLQAYLEKPSSDKTLLLISDKLDANVQKTTWFKMINKVGAFLPIWPLRPAEMPGWIQQRLQQRGLLADGAAVSLLAHLTEGNLLATLQMIERLSLLYPNERLVVDHIREVAADSARFNVFDLADKILQGDPLALLHTLQVLQEQAVEPVLILWAMTKEVRALIKFKQMLRTGQTISQVLAAASVWENRKPLLTHVLSIHSEKTLQDLLQAAARIDLLIKGLAVGAVWDELSTLALAIAGVRLHD